MNIDVLISVNQYHQLNQRLYRNLGRLLLKNNRTLMTQIELIFTDFLCQLNHYLPS